MSATPATRARYEVFDEEAVRKALSSATPPHPPSALSQAVTFGWRGMLKVKHVPEQLLDVTITPVMFVLMFTYLFGGAISGSTDAYLEYILPGILVVSVTFTTVYSGVSLNTDLTKGVVDRFRSLPIWRPAPLLGSLLGDSRPLSRRGHRDRRPRNHPRLRPRRRPAGRARGDAPGRPLLVRPLVGLHHPRPLDARPERGHERRLHVHLPPDLPLQRLRRAGDPAGGARGVRQRQPDLTPRRRHARPDGGHRRGLRDDRGAGDRGRPDRDLHADHDAAATRREAPRGSHADRHRHRSLPRPRSRAGEGARRPRLEVGDRRPRRGRARARRGASCDRSPRWSPCPATSPTAGTEAASSPPPTGRSTCSSTTPASWARARSRRSPNTRSPSSSASTRSTSSRRWRSPSSPCRTWARARRSSTSPPTPPSSPTRAGAATAPRRQRSNN